jgi:O-methyltransferase involved in polyketide biosynthesis
MAPGLRRHVLADLRAAGPARRHAIPDSLRAVLNRFLSPAL